MNLKQLVCLTGLCATFTAQADFLSVSVGGGFWNESPSGNLQKTSDTDPVDVNDDLFWKSESQGYFFATLEHPIPILPNVRIISTKIDQSGSGNANFTFNGLPFNTGTVSNDVSIKTTDVIAYYEVLDNIVSLDLGINIRSLSVDYNITNGINTTKDSVSETVPMLYAAIGASPWPDLIISGEVSYIAFSGSSVSDVTAKISYTTDFFVGLEAGYRKQTFKLDDVSDTNADLTFGGVFAGAYLKF